MSDDLKKIVERALDLIIICCVICSCIVVACVFIASTTGAELSGVCGEFK